MKKESISKNNGKQYVFIGELVKLSGIRDTTIRVYGHKGLLPYEQVDKGLFWRFEMPFALARLKEIQRLKDMGYTLNRIKDHLSQSRK